MLRATTYQCLSNLSICVSTLLAYIIPASCLAQGYTTIDSLRHVIATATQDTTKLNALLELTDHLYTSDPDTCLVICSDVLARSEDLLAAPGLGAAERGSLLRIRGQALNNTAGCFFVLGDLDRALRTFERALAEHENNGNTAGMAEALNNMGVTYEALGDHVAQRTTLFRALALYRNAKDTTNVANTLNNIGNYYQGLGIPDSAGAFLDSGLRTFQWIGDQHGAAQVLLNLGRIAEGFGHYPEALAHYHRAIPVLDSVNDLRGRAVCLNNIGAIYADQGLWSEALVEYHRALDAHLALGDRIGEATARQNIGTVLDHANELDMALEEYTKSLALYTATGDKRGEAMLYGHLGNVWKNKGDRIKAEELFRTSLAMNRAIGDPHGAALALYKLGHHLEDGGDLDTAMALYRECLAMERRAVDREGEAQALCSMGELEMKRGRLTEAAAHAEVGLAVARAASAPDNIARAANVLHRAWAQQGHWRRALDMLELYRLMKDSLDNTEASRRVVRQHLRYTFEAERMADSLDHALAMSDLEDQRRHLARQAEQARTRAWAMGSGGLLLLGMSLIVYRVDRRRRRERNEREAADLRTRALRAQMNPHFIFNALLSIDDKVQSNEPKDAVDFLDRFARLVDLVLDNSQRDMVPLSQDLEALRLYMDLERARLGGRFDHTVDMGPGIAPDKVVVPPLVLQPFVENAIWHGVARSHSTKRISITVRRDGPALRMVVEDDGAGRTAPPSPPDGTHKKTSLGTGITRERLATLGRQHGVECGFRYLEVSQGTRVELVLPFILA